jgi:hypothetical protein
MEAGISKLEKKTKTKTKPNKTNSFLSSIPPPLPPSL